MHLSHLGFPIAQDDKYGDFELNRAVAKQGVKRLMLHARYLAFRHPVTGEPLRVSAALPPDMKRLLQELRDRG